MDRFENMSAFIRVVEVGSITGAAERLGVAKSAVSRRLKELEEHLGVELFHRTTRQMNLTETGRAFYHQSVRILEDVLEAELALRPKVPEKLGTVLIRRRMTEVTDEEIHVPIVIEIPLIGQDRAIRIRGPGCVESHSNVDKSQVWAACIGNRRQILGRGYRK